MGFDILAFGAHPDDLEVAMGGTAAKLATLGLRALFVDLADGEPAGYAQHHVRREQALSAARSLGGERLVLDGTEPHEVDCLAFARCRMGQAWSRFDFAVDVSDVYEQTLTAIQTYESVFQGEQKTPIDRYRAEDQCIGSLVGVSFAGPFRARSPLLVDTPMVFKVRFG